MKTMSCHYRFHLIIASCLFALPRFAPAESDWQPPAIVSVEVASPETIEPLPGTRVRPGVFVLRRNGDARRALRVRLALGGTARNGRDYEWIPPYALIPAGRQTSTIRVSPLADTSGEPDETVMLRVDPGAGYVVSESNRGTVTIHEATEPRPGDLLNINFGLGEKTGPAALGKTTNDFWNLMGRAYDGNYTVSFLRLSDSSWTSARARLMNSGGIWGNQSGDTMYDSYVYPNSLYGDGVGDMTLTLTGLAEGTYDLVLYGHADHITPDNRPESDSVFSAEAGEATYGPAGTLASPLWVATSGWQEGRQYAVLRDVAVSRGAPVVITIKPGYDGQAGTLGWWDRVSILNGLQVVRH